MVGWTALMGPPGLPAEVVRYWKQTLQQVAVDPLWLVDNDRLLGTPAIRFIAKPDQFVYEQYLMYKRMALNMEVVR